MQKITKTLSTLQGKRASKCYSTRLSSAQLTTSGGDQLPLKDRKANRIMKGIVR